MAGRFAREVKGLPQSFTIKGRLPGYNELKARCWQESARRKADAMREVQIAAMAAKIKPVRRRISITIRCFEPNAKRDVDNVTAGAGKVVLDALQEIGVLAGDGRKYIEQVVYSKVEVDRKNPRIEVEMEICEENKGA